MNLIRRERRYAPCSANRRTICLGTLIGNFLRRYWTPVLLSIELSGPDSPPVRVRILGENFAGSRDTAGAIVR
jgi:hypothetical protein